MAGPHGHANQHFELGDDGRRYGKQFGGNTANRDLNHEPAEPEQDTLGKGRVSVERFDRYGAPTLMRTSKYPTLFRVPVEQPNLNPGSFQSLLEYAKVGTTVVVGNDNLRVEFSNRVSRFLR